MAIYGCQDMTSKVAIHDFCILLPGGDTYAYWGRTPLAASVYDYKDMTSILL
jgi:hypothetical protein